MVSEFRGERLSREGKRAVAFLGEGFSGES